MEDNKITLKNISNARGRIIELSISLEQYISSKITAYYGIVEEKENHFFFNVLYNKNVPNIALVEMLITILKDEGKYNSFPTNELKRLGTIRNFFAHSSVTINNYDERICKFHKTVDKLNDCNALFKEYEKKYKKVIIAMQNLSLQQ